MSWKPLGPGKTRTVGSPSSSNTLLSPPPRCGHPTWLWAPLSHLLLPPSLWSLVWKWPLAVPDGHGWATKVAPPLVGVTACGDTLPCGTSWGREGTFHAWSGASTLIQGSLQLVTCVSLEGWGLGWELGVWPLHRYPVTGGGGVVHL